MRSTVLAALGPRNSPVLTPIENSSPILSEAEWLIEHSLQVVCSGHLSTVFSSDWFEVVGNEKLV